jgi:peptidoglycan/LPS O-acetylase OafA/YrhL
LKKTEIQTRSNSFDLLRLAAATAVIVSHQFLLLGRPEPQIFNVAMLGFFAVLIFFGLSGALITQSWERDSRANIFLFKRCLRIFPALVVVVSLTVFIVGPAFTKVGIREYFFDVTTWEYFRTVILWPHHSWLPGVFESNPYPRAVNGSLWTLSIEFALYLSVLAGGIIGVLQRRYWVSLVVLLLSILTTAASFHHSSMVRDISLLPFMFWWGAWLRINFQSRKPFDKIDLTLGLAALMIMAAASPYSLARTGLILLASSFVWLATKIQFGDRITRRTGDLSYGVYIYAFPVQQCLVAAYGKEAFSYGEFLAISCTITFVLALLSWHLVEKHFIRMKNRGITPPKPVPV